jgi:hypothetical protein
MEVKAYLGRTMLARLLACLALVTGLAAVGAPASAAVVQSASQQVEAASQAPSKTAACTASEPRSAGTASDPAQVKCRARKPVVIYIPTVQFGPDRAFE